MPLPGWGTAEPTVWLPPTAHDHDDDNHYDDHDHDDGAANQPRSEWERLHNSKHDL